MPSLVPGFAYDVFISYRQNDNRSSWVKDFVEQLIEELAATQKNPVSVYFDENPHDGLNEHHDVSDSLKEKLKCLIFIPIVSRTYCDTTSFAWKNEFVAFVDQASKDSIGLKIKLQNGNVASRVLTIQIHEIDKPDAALFESVSGSVMRPIDFAFQASGVNRPLLENDKKEENLKHTIYRDQINKVANAIDEMVKVMMESKSGVLQRHSIVEIPSSPTWFSAMRRRLSFAASLVLMASVLFYIFYLKAPSLKDPGNSGIAVLPFRNNTGLEELNYYGVGMASEIRTKLSMSKQFSFLSALQATLPYNNSTKSPEEIGIELGVDYLLSGIYQKAGQKIKVDIELIEAITGKVAWTLSIEREESDIFEVQSDIAQRVLKKFSLVQPQNDDRMPTSSLAAYVAYVKGVESWLHKDDYAEKTEINRDIRHEEGIKQFESAVQLDSGFQEAWLELIESNSYKYLNGSNDSLRKKIEKYLAYVDSHFQESWQRNAMHGSYEYRVSHNYGKALPYLTKVLETDPGNPIATGLMSYLFKRKLEYGKSLEYKRRLFEINPNISSDWKDLADLLALMGDYPNTRRVRLKSWKMGNRNQMENLFNEVVRVGLPPDSVPDNYKSYFGDEYEMWKRLHQREWSKAISCAKKIKDYVVISGSFKNLNVDDSARYYARLGLVLENNELRKAWLYAILKDKQKAFAASDLFWKGRLDTEDDKMWQSYKMVVESMVLGLIGDSPGATKKIIDLNNRYPDFNDYTYPLQSHMTDKIRHEYPPYLQAINNRKQKPILDVQKFIKF